MFKLMTIIIISKIIPALLNNNGSNEEILKRLYANDALASLRKNLTICAKDEGASKEAIDDFLLRSPQKTQEGRCMVSCLFKKNNLYVNGTISRKAIIDANEHSLKDNHNGEHLLKRLIKMVDICFGQLKSDPHDECSYASSLNDCIVINMEKADNEERKKAEDDRRQPKERTPKNLNSEL